MLIILFLGSHGIYDGILVDRFVNTFTKFINKHCHTAQKSHNIMWNGQSQTQSQFKLQTFVRNWGPLNSATENWFQLVMRKQRIKSIAEQTLDRSTLALYISIRLLWKLIGEEKRTHGQTHPLNFSYCKNPAHVEYESSKCVLVWDCGGMQTNERARDSTALILLNHCYHFFEKQLSKHFAAMHEINMKTLV